MYYDPLSGPVCFPFGVAETPLPGFKWRRKRIATVLKKMVAPEPTDMPQLPPEPSENRILGAAKALFWTAVAIGIGTVLATVCK